MGTDIVAVVDPGPDVERHVRALAIAVQDADVVRIVVTHHHPDHAAAARPLAERLGAEVYGPPMEGVVDRPLGDGDQVETDDGVLVAVHTPGHTRDHLCFHWPEARALFAGDLFLGQGDTTWVAEYPGCVADYFGSLERVRSLDLDVIYPAHGPPLEDPEEAVARFEAHRRDRVRQVERALERLPDADLRRLMDVVYGDTVPANLAGAALRSLGALVEYVQGPRRD